jgi:hypothetical protein
MQTSIGNVRDSLLFLLCLSSQTISLKDLNFKSFYFMYYLLLII